MTIPTQLKAFVTHPWLRFAIAFLLLWLVFRQVNLSELVQKLLTTHPAGWIAYLLGSLLLAWLAGWRWALLVLPRSVTWHDTWVFFRATMLGLFYNLFMPSSMGGDVLKWTSLTHLPISRQRLIFTMLLDRVMGMMGLATVGFVALIIAEVTKTAVVPVAFWFASTSEVYGDPAVHPQPESYWGNVNPNGVRSCYDEGKRLGETISGVHERDFNQDVRIVRIFNTYGPRIDLDDGRVIPNFIQQALTNQPLTIYGQGTQTRSYCFVTDLVAGILLLALTPGLKGKTINLGNPEEFTTLETARLVQSAVTGQPAQTDQFAYKPLPGDDPTRRRPDIRLAQEFLGWTPTVSFADGLAQTVAYFKQKLQQ